MNWYSIKDGNDVARGIFDRHYSRRRYRDGRRSRKFVGPGEYMVLMNVQGTALLIWKRFIETGRTEPIGVNCAVFRNESATRSSDLILEAERFAWERWPSERLYTYVNPAAIRSTNPGYCFIVAGWTRLRETTTGGLRILEKLP